MYNPTPELPETGGDRPRVVAQANPDLSDKGSDIFFAAVSTTRMPMIVTDPHQPDNPIIFANPAFITMTGYGEDELIGRNCRFLQGPDTDADTVDDVRNAIAARREIAVEILNYKKSGASFWNALFISPVRDAEGNLVYFFASQLDVSRRRDAEDGLRQAQKMEAVGQLTGGIAHDFNNLLTVITGFTDMLTHQLDKPDRFDFAKAKRSAEAVLKAAERGASLTQQLLAFSRKQKLQGRVVNVNDLVRDLHPLIERTVGGQVQIETKLGHAPCNARIDPVQAELALINVLINARDALLDTAPSTGRIVIETGMVTIDAGDETFGDAAPGRYVTLAVRDTGAGMAPEILARITEPFFTTKEQGKGTGLGLSMVFGFVKQSGGVLRITSKEGDGTVVTMHFPCEDAPVETMRAPRSVVARPGRETILIVEDQSDVGDYAQAVLEEFGYRTLRAASGPEALELLDHEETIDLLFTDLIMPGGMNGVVLARSAKRKRPRIKVLLTTGYAEASIERVDARGTEFDIINKPYRRSDLASKVRIVLDGPTGVG